MLLYSGFNDHHWLVAAAAMATRTAAVFALSLLVLCSPRSNAAASNAIYAGESLSGDDTITSAGGMFELGFFRPGNSSNYYVGIWFVNVPQPNVVWVANRDTPLPDKSSTKIAILNGNLVLLPSNSSESPVWSTNLDPPESISNTTVAVLLDSGNLVLRDNLNSSQTIWESFDHQTDTWLPGSKLGYNKRTNRSQLLTSWKNLNDPAAGMFSLEHDPLGSPQYLSVWNGSRQYWTSGLWTDDKYFYKVPEMRTNYRDNKIQFNFSYVTNENESYFTYAIGNSSIKSRFIMDLSGQVKQQSWLEDIQQWYQFWSQPQRQCTVYALCGPFGVCNENEENFCSCLPGFSPTSLMDWNSRGWSGGCKRNANLQCGNTSANASSSGESQNEKERDKFLPQPNMKLPESPQVLSAQSNGDCESACLNNCSCSAYSYESTNGCSIWTDQLLDLQQLSQEDTSGKTLYIRLAASFEFPGEGSSSKEGEGSSGKGRVIGVAVGSAGGALALLGLLLVSMLRWRRLFQLGNAMEGSLLRFRYRDMQAATKSFSEKLGGGGFGSVFKGTLPNSTVIAVKKLEGEGQGEKQFRAEVSTIGTIQHVNLVRLRGFCSEGDQRLLVYDYMPNGSLNAHIFSDCGSRVLDWKTRYQVALGTARGLVYLHEKCRDCIVHCDIKPENILLDSDFCPKVADFGLAKLIGRDFSRVLTTVRGTRGYLAPEWISGLAITAKADVYSYGMMLFEFISGRRNAELDNEKVAKYFPSWAAKQVLEGGNVLSLLDSRLEGNADAEEITRVLRLACWCIQDEESNRPSMSQVVQVLEGVLDVEQQPMPRSLQTFVREGDGIVFFAEFSTNQSSQIRCSA